MTPAQGPWPGPLTPTGGSPPPPRSWSSAWVTGCRTPRGPALGWCVALALLAVNASGAAANPGEEAALSPAPSSFIQRSPSQAGLQLPTGSPQSWKPRKPMWGPPQTLLLQEALTDPKAGASGLRLLGWEVGINEASGTPLGTRQPLVSTSGPSLP